MKKFLFCVLVVGWWLITMGIASYVSQAQGPAVVIGWTASPTVNISGYFIYRSLTPGNFGPGWVKMNPSGPTTALTFTDTTVQRNITYYYVVTAYRGSDDSESLPTNEISAIVPNVPPQPASNLKLLQVIP